MRNTDKLSALLALSQELGDERLKMAILGEGNTSAKIDEETFIVKASESCLVRLPKMTLSSVVLNHCWRCSSSN